MPQQAGNPLALLLRSVRSGAPQRLIARVMRVAVTRPVHVEGMVKKKITMNINCTPDEARTYFGLPDVTPVQERLLKEMEERRPVRPRVEPIRTS